jgi:hypothetical protein
VDLTARAAQELYALDPADFTDRKQELARSARKAGDAVAGKQIAALRRPTQAAYLLNNFARANPDLVTELTELAAQLREAQRSLDGPQLQALSRQRRQLIDQTTRQVFAAARLSAPTAALRDDIAATLSAVLADPVVGADFAAGVLVKAVHQSGFGPDGPHLMSVAAPREIVVGRNIAAAKKISPAKSPGATSRAEKSAREAKRRQAAIESAERALELAESTSTKANRLEQETEQAVTLLTEQLADARRRRDDARLDARHAAGRLKVAQAALDHARKK